MSILYLEMRDRQTDRQRKKEKEEDRRRRKKKKKRKKKLHLRMSTCSEEIKRNYVVPTLKTLKERLLTQLHGKSIWSFLKKLKLEVYLAQLVPF